MNWHGDIKDWTSNAKKKGWIVKKELREAMPGAIAVFIKKGARKNYNVLGIVKEVTTQFVVIDYPYYNFDARVFKVYSSREYYTDYDKYGDSSFIGYIWPERIQPLSNNKQKMK